jgi:hypothetical protein
VIWEIARVASSNCLLLVRTFSTFKESELGKRTAHGGWTHGRGVEPNAPTQVAESLFNPRVEDCGLCEHFLYLRIPLENNSGASRCEWAVPVVLGDKLTGDGSCKALHLRWHQEREVGVCRRNRVETWQVTEQQFRQHTTVRSVRRVGLTIVVAPSGEIECC